MASKFDEFYSQITDLSQGDSTNPEERKIIIKKYDKGRDEGADITAWEDPDLSIYKCTDRYGFMQLVK